MTAQLYPVNLTEDDNGTLLLTFQDFPEAATYGADPEDALDRGRGALIAAIASRIDDGEPIPAPSNPHRGQPTVALPPLVATKTGIYQMMRQLGITKAELARRLGQNPRQVDRLLDVTHSSRHDQLDRALAALGKRIEIRIIDAA